MSDKLYGAMNKQYGTIDERTLSYNRDDVQWLMVKNNISKLDYEIVAV